MLYRINIFLACLLVLVVAMLAFSRVDHSRPNYQVVLGDDMTYSPAYTSFSKNDNFTNGRTLQPPVQGTIARGEQVFHFESTPQDALRAGVELINPIDLTTDEGKLSPDRGAATFETFCVSCHGGDGTGNGPVAKRGFPPPPSLLIGKSREMKDGQLFHILTYGQNSMPRFAAQLPPGRRWDVINYIRSLQQAVPPLAESTDTAPVAEAEPIPQTEAAPADEPESPAEAKEEATPEAEPAAAQKEELDSAPTSEPETTPAEEKPAATSSVEANDSPQPEADSSEQADTETQP